jgi:hypothetical protein
MRKAKHVSDCILTVVELDEVNCQPKKMDVPEISQALMMLVTKYIREMQNESQTSHARTKKHNRAKSDWLVAKQPKRKVVQALSRKDYIVDKQALRILTGSTDDKLS